MINERNNIYLPVPLQLLIHLCYNMYRIVFLATFLLSSMMAFAQMMTVESFELKPMDLSARINQRLDTDGNSCAIVRVMVQDSIVSCSESVGPIESKGITKTIYIPSNTAVFSIVLLNHNRLVVNVNQYGIDRLDGLCVYELKIIDAVNHNSNTTSERNESIPYYIDNDSFVDLGLSVKWANANLGAKAPSDYGDYFLWINKNQLERVSIEENNVQKPETPNLTISTNSEGWRLPTNKEIDELIDECEWKWTKKRGVTGYKVTGVNGNSIFLPASGYLYYSSEMGVGSYVSLWSSTFTSLQKPSYLLAYPQIRQRLESDFLHRRNIRPVIENE